MRCLMRVPKFGLNRFRVRRRAYENLNLAFFLVLALLPARELRSDCVRFCKFARQPRRIRLACIRYDFSAVLQRPTQHVPCIARVKLFRQTYEGLIQLLEPIDPENCLLRGHDYSSKSMK